MTTRLRINPSILLETQTHAAFAISPAHCTGSWPVMHGDLKCPACAIHTRHCTGLVQRFLVSHGANPPKKQGFRRASILLHGAHPWMCVDQVGPVAFLRAPMSACHDDYASLVQHCRPPKKERVVPIASAVAAPNVFHGTNPKKKKGFCRASNLLHGAHPWMYLDQVGPVAFLRAPMSACLDDYASLVQHCRPQKE